MDHTVHHLRIPGGDLAYTLSGAGPLVVTSPGMGDLRAVFRDVVAPLVAAGYRVACADLRGHGDSSPHADGHGIRATAADLGDLVAHLGGAAVVVGSSCSAGSGVLLAADRPDLVAGLVLIGPHVPHAAPSRTRRLVTRLQVEALGGPWGAAAWAAYYRSLHTGRRAPWFAEHLAAVRDNVRRRPYRRAFTALARSLVTVNVALPLEEVAVPTLVLHGAADPEFRDPAAELEHVVHRLTGAPASGHLVPDAGHYPHSQRPDVVVPAILRLLEAAHGASTDLHPEVGQGRLPEVGQGRRA